MYLFFIFGVMKRDIQNSKQNEARILNRGFIKIMFRVLLWKMYLI